MISVIFQKHIIFYYQQIAAKEAMARHSWKSCKNMSSLFILTVFDILSKYDPYFYWQLRTPSATDHVNDNPSVFFSECLHFNLYFHVMPFISFLSQVLAEIPLFLGHCTRIFANVCTSTYTSVSLKCLSTYSIKGIDCKIGAAV